MSIDKATTTLTATEVAADLRLARNTVTLYLKTGKIPGGFKPVAGGRWLVDRAMYQDWRSGRLAELDPYRIPPRSARSQAAQNRRRTR